MIGYPGTMRVARLPAVVLVGALAAAVGGGCAARRVDRPSVVVLEVKGARDDTWQTRVADLAARRFEVIPADRYWVMAKRLRARALTARNVARVAGSLGAEAVIHGRVSGKRRRQVVTIQVRSGESGRVVEKHRVLLRRGVAVARSEAALERRLLAKVRSSEPAVAARPAGKPAKASAKAGANGTTSAPPTVTARPTVSARPKVSEPPRREPPARERRAARPTRPEPEPTEARPPVVYDERGQAIDDELPPVRK
jgi:hypothetical protein